MKLQMNRIFIKDLAFGEETKVENHTLFINKERIVNELKKEPGVKDIDIDFDALLSSKQQNQIVFYIWDKVYPADKKTSLDPNNIPGFKLEEKNEINTPVHEPIVKLVWKKKEN